MLLFSRDSVSNCASSTKGAILERLLLSRDKVVSCVSPVSKSIVDRLFPSSIRVVRLDACCNPVRSLILVLLAVSDVNVSMSAKVSITPLGLPRVSTIFACKSPSGTDTGKSSETAVALNWIDCVILGTVTCTVVVPPVSPNVKRVCALPFVSVFVFVVLSLPSPSVIVNRNWHLCKCAIPLILDLYNKWER